MRESKGGGRQEASEYRERSKRGNACWQLECMQRRLAQHMLGGVGNSSPAALLGVVLGSISELSGGENVTTGPEVSERNERTVRSADGDVRVCV